MNASSQPNTSGHHVVQRQQAVVRAVVGSIVLCAALGVPSVQAQETSQQGVERIELRNVSIDLRSLHELLTKGATMSAEGHLRFDDTFDFSVEADRAADGTLSNVKFTGTESREGWHKLAGEFITALSVSRALAVLEDACCLKVTFWLDSGRVGAVASISFHSEEQAAQRAKSYGAYVASLRNARPVTPENEVLNNMTVSANGKQLVMASEMSREQAGNLLRQHLALP